MTLDEAVLRLRKVRKTKGPDGAVYDACCPAHHDKSPSLRLWEKDGWWHVKCFSSLGCDESAILSAMGMTEEDRRIETRVDVDRPQKPPDVTYEYQDRRGKPVFRKVRTYKWEDGKWKKGTPWQRPDADKWVWNAGENKKPIPTAGILYRLPDVIAGIKAGKRLYIHEGEKAVDDMFMRGMVATCQPFGAQVNAWSKEHTLAIKGAKDVFIVADCDEAGEIYAQAVATALSEFPSVSIVQCATLLYKTDSFDHFAAGFAESDWVDRDDLLADEAFNDILSGILIYAKETHVDEVVEHYWDPYMPKHCPVFLDGPGGSGKSTIALMIAACLSQGREPFGHLVRRPVKTLYLHSGEDSNNAYQTVYARAGGADGGLIMLPEEFVDGFTLRGSCLSTLGRLMKNVDAGFLVCDPFFDFTGAKDINDMTEAASIMRPFRNWCLKSYIGALCLRHTKKIGSQWTGDISELGLGSVAWRNKARGQLMMLKHPEKKGISCLVDVKGGILNPTGEGFCVRRGYMGNFEIIETEPNPYAKPTGEESKAPKNVKTLDAQSAILEILGAVWITGRELKAKMDECGFSGRTYERARGGLLDDGRIVRDGNGENTRYAVKGTYDPDGDE